MSVNTQPQNMKKMTRSTKCGIGLVICSVAFIIIGCVFSSVIMSTIKQSIEKSVAIRPRSVDKKSFDDWVTTTNPQWYWRVYLFNMTNYHDVVRHGAVPHVKRCGPYVYRQIKLKYNITWPDDYKQVFYLERPQYVFDKQETDRLSHNTAKEDDIIVNFWMTAHTATQMDAGGSQLAFEVGFTQMTLLASIVQVYTELCAIPPPFNILPAASCVDPVKTSALWWTKLGGVQKQGWTSFYRNNIIHQFLVNPKSKTYSTPQTRMLFGTLAQYLSEVNLYQEFGTYLQKRDINETAFFSDDDAVMLFTGMGHKYPCGMIGNVTISIQGMPQTVPCPLSLFLDKESSTPKMWQNLTAPQKGYLEKYFLETGARIWDWGSTRKPHEWIFSYNDPILVLQSQPDTDSAFFSHSNFSTTHDAQVSPYTPRHSAYYTGIDDPDMASKWLQWNGIKQLPEIPSHNADLGVTGQYWCHTSPVVHGHEDSQVLMAKFTPFSYEPRVTDSAVFIVWVDNMYRPVDFRHHRDLTVKGVKTKRYEIGDENFAVDPLWDIGIPGLLNMSCPEHGVPAYISLPRWLKLAAPKELTNVVGATDGQSYEDDSTFLDVEPISGTVVQGYKRFQINLMAEGLFQFGVESRPWKRLIPIISLEETGTLTDDQAHDVKKLYDALSLQKGILWGFVGSGIGLFVLGLILVYVGCKSKQAPEPELERLVNDDSANPRYNGEAEQTQ